MYRVSREISFSYGHRIVGHEGKCANLHGHNGRVTIEISSEKLNHLGMVVDFYEIKEKLGAWIDQNLDHRMILAENDPLLEPIQKAGDPVVVLPENPTAEVLARLIFEAARKLRLPVSRVTLRETEHCSAIYHE